MELGWWHLLTAAGVVPALLRNSVERSGDGWRGTGPIGVLMVPILVLMEALLPSCRPQREVTPAVARRAASRQLRLHRGQHAD